MEKQSVELFLKRAKEIIYHYREKIPKNMENYFQKVLQGNNLDMYMEMFSLSREDLIKYARICKIKNIYDQISELIELIKDDVELVEQDLIASYNLIGELIPDNNALLESIGAKEPETIDTNNESSTNLLIYPPYIEESNRRTINARSGKEDQTQKSVASLIRQLIEANYQELRKTGCFHAIKDSISSNHFLIDNILVERIGGGTTKVIFIRIPVSEKNNQAIKNAFNINLNTLYLVVYYGDFKNDGINETQYYSRVCADLRKNQEIISSIINIFKSDFTQETLPAAIDLINGGFKITEDLTASTNIQKLDM